MNISVNKSWDIHHTEFGYCILEVDLKTNTFLKTINLILSRTASVVFIFETIEVVTYGGYDDGYSEGKSQYEDEESGEDE